MILLPEQPQYSVQQLEGSGREGGAAPYFFGGFVLPPSQGHHKGFPIFGKRGQKHIRAGMEYLHSWGRQHAKVFLPADVCRWVCALSPENSFLTPLEFVMPA